MRNPYLFIVGCPRSGTTLLQRMVNSHREVAITPESHWIPRLYGKPWAVNEQGMISRKLIDRLLAHPKFARLRLGPGQIAALADSAEAVSYSDLVSTIFDLYGRAQGKPLVGDKTPDYVRTIETLHRLWPSARFVHVIRDGRDVALSMLDWPKVDPKPGSFASWNRDKISTAALWWELNVRLGRQAGGSLAPHLYHEVGYESLVNNPEAVCRALCDFLAVHFDEAMLRFHDRPAPQDPGVDKTRAGLPVTMGLRSWREQMSPDDLESFEAAAGELLDEIGYPLAASRIRRNAVESAGLLRKSLLSDPGLKDEPWLAPQVPLAQGVSGGARSFH